jgi:hypothetical protein
VRRRACKGRAPAANSVTLEKKPKAIIKLRKGVSWMPWRQEATKDAASCDKPRRAGARVDPWVSEWGNPAGVTAGDGGPERGGFPPRHGRQATPGEVKHLSNRRNRKRKFDSVSSGERSRKSPNPQEFLRGLKGPRPNGTPTVRLSGWKAAPQRVRGP